MFFSVRGSSPATLPALLPRCVHRVPTSRARAVVAAVYHSAWPPGSGSGCTWQQPWSQCRAPITMNVTLTLEDPITTS